eukprot:CAMPEP_0195003950 /NCGR_PEP_ID=MMETSP0326_2-20130528/3866_1 /TAXON_ID=2866 ORGANISM="Crypthecodinium cohnii, Strain Seligo" /NCGR_SAMPLE_ID=MMETSP0326_2 /ASSEMBLY_ACC=CAM_ASM_000348 /LENGTH=87 /DNA_ID=CAMNT_0040008457 /DNA_START=481 /DNA_END=740 /DNA_ORIENTATION=+
MAKPGAIICSGTLFNLEKCSPATAPAGCFGGTKRMSHHHAAVANRSDKTAGQSRSEQPRIWRQCFKQQRAACRQNEKEVGDNAINRG